MFNSNSESDKKSQKVKFNLNIIAFVFTLGTTDSLILSRYALIF